MSSSADPMAAFLRGLKGFVRSLPSEEERAELLRTLRSARDFLDEVRQLVDGIPTLESSRDLSHAMSRLDLLASEARSNSGVSKMLGLPKASTARANPPQDDVDTAARVERLWKNVEASEKSEIVQSLSRSGESVSVFKAFASTLGLRVRSRESRAGLIQRIATHIENERNYRLLRGETPEAALRPPKKKVS